MRNANGLYKLLKKLEIKGIDSKMRYPSWLESLRRNIFKKEIVKEIKSREQEIKDYKTKQRT